MNKQTALARTLIATACALAAVQPALAQQIKETTPSASAQPESERPIIVAQTTADEMVSDDVVVLSPFQVDARREKGYFAENTLAGSRMRTNISDLGSAISVVTKQQLEDTASLDVNDIFRYEIGTEGSSTYTPEGLTSRGNGVSDAIAGINNGGNTTASTNTTANRVRGLGAPGFSLNYYTAISQIPFDTYNAASFEISRGPNSMLFGMGSPAGIVNQSTAQALLNKKSAQVQFRVDDRASVRAAVNFNIPLIADKLAVYGALLYNDQQFERKPSYDITRRQYGAITYKPFKSTKITASIEGYNNDNRRPNSVSPVDGVSEWLHAGRPVYDSKTHRVTSLDTGRDISMVVGSAASYMANDLRNFIATLPGFDATKWNADRTQYNGISIFGTGAITNINSILFVPGMNFQSSGRTMMKVADGTLQRWFQPTQGNNPRLRYDVAPSASTGYNVATTVSELSTTAGAANYVWGNPAWTNVYDTYETMSALTSLTVTPPTPNYLTKRYPAVTDKSIYDWEHVNILEMSVGWQKNTNYNIELEQEIVPNLLTLSAGWFRQDFDSMQLYNVGSLDGTTLFVDTNIYDSEGNPNPLFGRPYVQGTNDPDRIDDSQLVDQYRAMLAFTPDFTKNKGWTKWLGRHQILGLVSYMDNERTTIRKRLQFYDGAQMVKTRYMASPDVPGWRLEGNQSYALFYLSDGGYRVNQSSGPFYPGGDAPISGGLTVYDYTASQYRNLDATMIWNPHFAGTGKSARELTSYSGGWTAYLWNDRIIATAGIRRDINKTRATRDANTRPAGLTPKQAVEWDATYWVNGVYQLDKVFELWNDWARVAGTTSTLGAVVKPFLHWDSISKRADDNLFWEFVENLGFSYNKSDNFDAPTTSFVDFFGTKLGKPQGTGEDYGVQFSLFKEKLFARINWFESTNENSPAASGSNNAIQRLWQHVDTTAYRGWLEHIWLLNQGADPSQPDWKKRWTDDTEQMLLMQQWVGQQWGLKNDYNYYGNLGGTLGSTKSTRAKGTELSITYNPLPNWTIKLTGSKIVTKNDNVLKEVDAWLAVRDPIWKNAKGADFLNATGLATLQRLGGINSYTLYNTERRGNIENFWSSTNYEPFSASTTINSTNIDGWTTVEGYYNAVYYPNYALERDLQGQQVTGQRKYNLSLVTNYQFTNGALKGWSVGGAQRYSSKAIIGYYGKASGANGALLDISDVSRPIYDDPEWYTDLWIAYTRKIFRDKVRMKLQLNVTDIFQDGELKPIRVAFDGMPYAYRIIDSRSFILSATFDF